MLRLGRRQLLMLKYNLQQKMLILVCLAKLMGEGRRQQKYIQKVSFVW